MGLDARCPRQSDRRVGPGIVFQEEPWDHPAANAYLLPVGPGPT